jgi:hypothetical protein
MCQRCTIGGGIYHIHSGPIAGWCCETLPTGENGLELTTSHIEGPKSTVNFSKNNSHFFDSYTCVSSNTDL